MFTSPLLSLSSSLSLSLMESCCMGWQGNKDGRARMWADADPLLLPYKTGSGLFTNLLSLRAPSTLLSSLSVSLLKVERRDHYLWNELNAVQGGKGGDKRGQVLQFTFFILSVITEYLKAGLSEKEKKLNWAEERILEMHSWRNSYNAEILI